MTSAYDDDEDSDIKIRFPVGCLVRSHFDDDNDKILWRVTDHMVTMSESIDEQTLGCAPVDGGMRQDWHASWMTRDRAAELIRACRQRRQQRRSRS